LFRLAAVSRFTWIALVATLLVAGCGGDDDSEQTQTGEGQAKPQTLQACLADLDLEFQPSGTSARIQSSDGALYASADLFKTSGEATKFLQQLPPTIERGHFGRDLGRDPEAARVVVTYNAGADGAIITDIEICLVTTDPAAAFGG
jgi:hypothetical protein